MSAWMFDPPPSGTLAHDGYVLDLAWLRTTTRLFWRPLGRLSRSLSQLVH